MNFIQITISQINYPLFTLTNNNIKSKYAELRS